MRLHPLFKRKTQRSALAWHPKPTPKQTPTVVLADRRHLVEVPYVLPKDMLETSRIDFQHYLLHTIVGAHYAAPLHASSLTHILDVGTGSGIWAREMARLFPHAYVTGFDVEHLPSPTHAALINVQLVKGDVLQGLPFDDQSFDYVHQRLLVAGIPATSWSAVVRDLVRVTRMQGWVELLEAGDGYLYPGPAMTHFLQWGRAVSQKCGLNASLMAQIGTMLRRAGLTEVTERTFQVPLGSWGGRLGELLATDTIAAFEGLQGLYSHTLSLSPQQFQQIIAALPQEWNAYHTSFPFFLAYGQKTQEV